MVFYTVILFFRLLDDRSMAINCTNNQRNAISYSMISTLIIDNTNNNNNNNSPLVASALAFRTSPPILRLLSRPLFSFCRSCSHRHFGSYNKQFIVTSSSVGRCYSEILQHTVTRHYTTYISVGVAMYHLLLVLLCASRWFINKSLK